MAYRYKKTDKFDLTPEFVKKFRDLPTWDGDRKMRPSNVKRLQIALENGTFHAPKWAVVTCLETGVNYRVNGNHSSYVLQNAEQKQFPDGLSVIVDKFEADTTKGVADCWGDFDNQTSVRSLQDLLNAAQNVHDNLRGMKVTNTTTITNGIGYALYPSQGGKLDGDSKKEFVHEYADFYLWANQFIAPKMFRRGPVIAVMFRTYQIDQEIAAQFWTLVREESHPNVKHSTRKLAKFLREASMKECGANKGKWTPMAFYVKTVLAWNAFVRNKECDILKFVEEAYYDKKGKVLHDKVPALMKPPANFKIECNVPALID